MIDDFAPRLPTRAEGDAAEIIADLFTSRVLTDLQADMPRRFLYGWEERAVEWLREYRLRGGKRPLCAWAMTYVSHGGPPPWPQDETL